MKFIEEHIRRLLGREEPPAVDADDLWAGIAAGLPEETDVPVAAASQRYRGWLGLGLMALLLVIGGVHSFRSSESIDARHLPSPEKSLVDGTEVEGVRPNVAPAGREATSLENTTPHNQALDGSTETLSSTSRGATPHPRGSRSTAPRPFRETQSPRNTDAQMIAETEQTAISLPPSIAPDLSPAPAPAPVSKAGRNIATAVSQLPTNTLSKIATSSVLPSRSVQLTKFSSAGPVRLSVGLHAGTNALLSNFRIIPEGPASSLNRATKTALGQSLALDVRYRLNDRFAVTLGAEYHRTLNTFRHTEERDTMIFHPTAPNTRLISSTVLHTVSHNNRSSVVSVPVTLSYHRPVGQFSLGLGVGVSGNFLLQNSGRTLGATGNFARYDEVADKGLFLGYHLRPELSYRLNHRWTLEGRLDVRRYGVRAAALAGIEQRQSLLSGIIGLRYGLN